MSRPFISGLIRSGLGVCALFLLGCSNSGSHGPSRDTVRGKLVFELPAYVIVDSFDVLVSENFGSEVEPFIRARFSADAKISEPLYQEIAEYGDTDVLHVQSDKGSPLTVNGVYSARLRGSTWVVTFDDLTTSPTLGGSTLSNWTVGRYVMAGSPEEAELIEEDRKAKEAAANAAEADRIRKVREAEERTRAALEETRKTEALKARLEKERVAAREAALGKQKASKTAFRKSVVGTWNPVGSIMHRRGNVYSNGRHRVAISMRFTIPQTTHDTFVIPLTMYATEYPSAQFTTDATVTLDANSRSISLAFPGRKPISMACVGEASKQCEYYSSSGTPWTGIVQNNEVKLVGYDKRTITMRKS